MPWVEEPIPQGFTPPTTPVSPTSYLPGPPSPQAQPPQPAVPSRWIEEPVPTHLQPKPGAPKTPDPLQLLRNSPDLRQQVIAISRSLDRPAPEVESLIATRASQTGETPQQILQQLTSHAAKNPVGDAAGPARQVPVEGGKLPAITTSPYFGATTPAEGGLLQQIRQDPSHTLEKGMVGAWNTLIVHPLGAIGHVIGMPSELTEHYLTGGQGYDTWLQQHGVQNPTARTVGSLALRTLLDPTNILLAPAVPEKLLTVGVRVANTAFGMARGAKMAEPLANALADMEKLHAEGTLTDEAVTSLTGRMKQHYDGLLATFDRTYGLPEPIKRAFAQFHSGIVDASVNAVQLKRRVMDLIPVPADRMLTSHMLESPIARNLAQGKVAASQAGRALGIKEQLVSRDLMEPFTQLAAASDEATARAMSQGLIGSTRMAYVRHILGADDPKFRAILSSKMRGLQLPTADEEVLSGAIGRQIRPIPSPVGTTLRAALERAYPTINDLKKAGFKPLEDAAHLLPLHELEIGLGENSLRFVKRVVQYGREEVGGQDLIRTMDEAPAGWVKVTDFIGQRAAQKAGIENMMMEPRLARFVGDIMGNPMPRNFTKVFMQATSGLKSLVFFNPLFHGANVFRSAFLADGLRVFSPKYWQDWSTMVRDSHEGGPWLRRFLDAGGSVGTSSSREMADSAVQILGLKPADTVLKRDGVSLVDRITHPFRTVGEFKEYSDHILWDHMDRGMRLNTFRHFTEQGMKDVDAARYTNLFINDYSRSMLTDAEKQLANVFFTYSWNKGRLRLFGNMAKSLIPNSFRTEAEKYVMQRATMRWTAANLVMPHIWRIAVSKMPTAGMYGNLTVAGQQTSPTTGFQRPVYANYPGFYGDALQFLTHPVAYAFQRTNPFIRTAFDLLRAQYTAQQVGTPESQVLGQTLAQEVLQTLPAGVPAAFTPGRSALARALPFFGVPVTSTPPPPEDPKIHLHDALMHQDYVAAAQIIHDNNMGLQRILPMLPYEDRKEVERMYRLFTPRTSAGAAPFHPFSGLR